MAASSFAEWVNGDRHMSLVRERQEMGQAPPETRLRGPGVTCPDSEEQERTGHLGASARPPPEPVTHQHGYSTGLGIRL